MTRPLYENESGYEAPAVGRPGTPAYSPPRLSATPPAGAQRRVLLFSIRQEDGSTYEGTIPDPLPASYFAQMLLDVPAVGVQAAEALMLNRVMGRANLEALAACPTLGPDDMLTIMAEVQHRAMGPYRAAAVERERGNSQSG